MDPGGRLNMKMSPTSIGIPMLKIRRSPDLLIFIMGIAYLERPALYRDGVQVSNSFVRSENNIFVNVLRSWLHLQYVWNQLGADRIGLVGMLLWTFILTLAVGEGTGKSRKKTAGKSCYILFCSIDPLCPLRDKKTDDQSSGSLQRGWHSIGNFFVSHSFTLPPKAELAWPAHLVSVGLLPDTKTCVLHMRRECRERFLRHQLQRKPLVSDPGMHHSTCVTHVPWCMSGSLTRGGGETVPGIPGACATLKFTYLARSPLWWWRCDVHSKKNIKSKQNIFMKMCLWVLISFTATIFVDAFISNHKSQPLYRENAMQCLMKN